MYFLEIKSRNLTFCARILPQPQGMVANDLTKKSYFQYHENFYYEFSPLHWWVLIFHITSKNDQLPDIQNDLIACISSSSLHPVLLL